jgi:hypothetical protein
MRQTLRNLGVLILHNSRLSHIAGIWNFVVLPHQLHPSHIARIVGSAAIMGFLGIIEDKHLTHVPATVVLSEEQNPLAVAEGTAPIGLKHGTGKDANIILIPQP